MTEPPAIFDHVLIDLRRRRALRQTPVAFLLATVAGDLRDRLAAVSRRFPLAADIGTPLPLLADRIMEGGQVDALVHLDRLGLAGGTWTVVGDEEFLPFRPQSLDLAVSALSLQFVNDLPGALVQIRHALKPDGLFLAALLGGETLGELRQSFAVAESEMTGGASPRVAPFAEVRALGALLQRAGFALPVADQDRLVVRYRDPFALMREIRAMGAANPLVERDRRPLPRSILMRAAEVYAERYSDADGRIRATFDVVSLSGWAPHESQQQPLRPGSARMRLADALGVAERPAGDRAGG